MTTYDLDESEVQSLREEMKQNRYGKKIQCPDCEGDGTVGVTIHTENGEYDGEKDCETCEGSGEVFDDEAAR